MKQNATLDSSFWINAYRSGLHTYVIDRYQLNFAPAVASELLERFAAGRAFWRLVRQGILLEAIPKLDDIHDFGPGERDAINLALEHRDWVLLIDDRKPLLEAERRGLSVASSPVMVLDLFAEGRLDNSRATEYLARLVALQTVSPNLWTPALAHLAALIQARGVQ